MPRILDLQGKRYGRLQVIERARLPNEHNVMWRCLCDCGNETIIAAANIGKTTFSCGCLAKETARKILTGNTYTRTHNQSHTTEHDIWLAIKQRCYNANNPKYPIYGGRGITVCDRWIDSFEAFFEDMGKRPSKQYSIDRYPDNDGPYSPENCRWATREEQARNSRVARMVEIDGLTMCVEDWCIHLGVPKWRMTEMTRAGRGKNKRPAECKDSEEAIRMLYHHPEKRLGQPRGGSQWHRSKTRPPL